MNAHDLEEVKRRLEPGRIVRLRHRGTLGAGIARETDGIYRKFIFVPNCEPAEAIALDHGEREWSAYPLADVESIEIIS